MTKKIEIFYDVDFGIFTMKSTGFNLSKTKIYKIERKIRSAIIKVLEEIK